MDCRRKGAESRKISNYVMRVAAGGMFLASAAAAQADVSGRWTGSYSCDGAASALVLDIEPYEGNGRIEGLFSFTAAGGAGRYRVAGNLAPDGMLTLAPDGWVERPAGFAAVGLEAALSADGRLLEGRAAPCSMSALSVARDEPVWPVGEMPPPSLSGGDFAGFWRGNVECRANRRGNTELLPLSMMLWQDGSGVGGHATVRIWQRRNSGGGAYWGNSIIVSGSAEGGRLTLDQVVVLDGGGAPYPLRHLAGELRADGSLAGAARLRTCESFTVSRQGPAVAPSWSDGAEGLWTTETGDGRNGALVTLHGVSGTEPPFWLLDAVGTISSRGETRRERLNLVLVPVAGQNGAAVLAPVNMREAPSPRSRSPVQPLAASRAFVLRPVSDGALELRAIPDGTGADRELAAAIAGAAPTGSRGQSRQYRLERPTAAVAGATGVAEPPPLDGDAALAGKWEGTFTCDERRDVSMMLAIRPDGAGVSGEFEFRRGGVRGIYEVRGSVERDGTFLLRDRRWIRNPGGWRAFPLRGQLTGQGREISGTIAFCRESSFHATRTGDAPPLRVVPTDPEARMRFLEEEWTAYVRAQIAELVEEREESPWRWREIDHEIMFRAPRATVRAWQDEIRAKQAELSAEVAAARAGLAADGLLAQLAAGPTDYENGGMGRALYVADQARTRDWWPAEERERVVGAAQARAADVLRPKLQAAAQLADDLPATLDGLVAARAALEPVERYRHSLERAFRTVDPEGLLQPLMQRIAAVESDETFRAELRAALAQARRGGNPIVATEELLHRVLGPNPSTRLTPLMSQARELALIAAIVVEDRSGSRADPLEPSAWNIAASVHTTANALNNLVAGMERRCRTGQYSNPLQAVECLPILSLDVVGGLRVRVNRIEKHGCEVEVPGKQFMCSFFQNISVHSAAGGPLAPDLSARLIEMVMPGYRGEMSQARFTREGEPGQERWVVTRDQRPVAASGGGPVACPYGEYDAGGFCFPFDAFGNF